jgi:hypothetical protein
MEIPEKEKLLHCHRVAWIIEAVLAEAPKNFGAKPKQQMNYSSRTRKGPAVLL